MSQNMVRITAYVVVALLVIGTAATLISQLA